MFRDCTARVMYIDFLPTRRRQTFLLHRMGKRRHQIAQSTGHSSHIPLLAAPSTPNQYPSGWLGEVRLSNTREGKHRKQLRERFILPQPLGEAEARKTAKQAKDRKASQRFGNTTTRTSVLCSVLMDRTGEWPDWRRATLHRRDGNKRPTKRMAGP